MTTKETFIEEREGEFERLISRPFNEIECGNFVAHCENCKGKIKDNILAFHRETISLLLGILKEEVGKIAVVGVGAIPETNDYANGWNDCRKEYFSRKFEPFRVAVEALLTIEK